MLLIPNLLDVVGEPPSTKYPFQCFSMAIDENVRFIGSVLIDGTVDGFISFYVGNTHVFGKVD